MNYSKQIESFLDFLREAQYLHGAAASDEKRADNETQDILHAIELNDSKYQDYVNLGVALRTIRQDRRIAKDNKQKLQPIIDWINHNTRVIKDLEKLLGAVRKEEKYTKGRNYNPKTDILGRVLEDKKDG